MATTEHLTPTVVLGKDVVSTVRAPGGGVHGYSSSGHSDASHHMNGVANVNSTDTSRQGSLEAATVAGASATVPVVPAASPKPPLDVNLAVDVQQSVVPSPTSAVYNSNPDGAAAAPVQQQQEDPAAGSKQEPSGSATAAQDEQGAPALPAAAVQAIANAALPPLSPLPAPDSVEPPEVHAEYAVYLERFKAGDTLAQRWQRLEEKGKLQEIQEEWEEWQQDLMLQKLQAQIHAADKGRKRKPVDSDLDPEAPRQTRNRRAPSSLQDYQVEAPAASGSGAAGVREDTPGLISGRPTGTANGRAVGEHGSDDMDEHYAEEPEQRGLAGRAGRGNQQQQQRGSRGAYRPPPPVVTQQPRGGPQQQHQAWGRWQQQQPVAGVLGAAEQPGMSQELMHQLYQMGTAMGAALQSSGASGAAGQGAAGVPSPGAMQAALEMCTRMWGSDPAVIAQHMQALVQQAPH